MEPETYLCNSVSLQTGCLALESVSQLCLTLCDLCCSTRSGLLLTLSRLTVPNIVAMAPVHQVLLAGMFAILTGSLLAPVAKQIPNSHRKTLHLVVLVEAEPAAVNSTATFQTTKRFCIFAIFHHPFSCIDFYVRPKANYIKSFYCIHQHTTGKSDVRVTRSPPTLLKDRTCSTTRITQLQKPLSRLSLGQK